MSFRPQARCLVCLVCDGLAWLLACDTGTRLRALHRCHRGLRSISGRRWYSSSRRGHNLSVATWESLSEPGEAAGRSLLSWPWFVAARCLLVSLPWITAFEENVPVVSGRCSQLATVG